MDLTCNSQMGLKHKEQSIIRPSGNNQVHLFQVQMNSVNSNDIAKKLLKVSKCLQNVLDKVLEVVLTLPLSLIILEIRVDQLFMELVLVLVTLAVLRISVSYHS